ncbi:MAG: cell division protein ZapA [Alphaproteobacteria bacterium]|nr:cell division protein ZapA [Alphaproteobacteria bacterium]
MSSSIFVKLRHNLQLGCPEAEVPKTQALAGRLSQRFHEVDFHLAGAQELDVLAITALNLLNDLEEGQDYQWIAPLIERLNQIADRLESRLENRLQSLPTPTDGEMA